MLYTLEQQTHAKKDQVPYVKLDSVREMARFYVSYLERKIEKIERRYALLKRPMKKREVDELREAVRTIKTAFNHSSSLNEYYILDLCYGARIQIPHIGDFNTKTKT